MTDPNERRRIVWGDGEHANLDPFVVDVFGRVFNGGRPEPITAIDREAATDQWYRHTPPMKTPSRRWPEIPADKTKRLEPRELVGMSDDLLVDLATGEHTRSPEAVTRWLFTLRARDDASVWRDRDARPPARMIVEPPDWLPLAGDPDDGWYCVRIDARFASVFHGPSLAAWLFADSLSTCRIRTTDTTISKTKLPHASRRVGRNV